MEERARGRESYKAPRWIIDAIKRAQEGLMFANKGIALHELASFGQQRVRSRGAFGSSRRAPTRLEMSSPHQSAKSDDEWVAAGGLLEASTPGFGQAASSTKSQCRPSSILHVAGDQVYAPQMPNQATTVSREMRAAAPLGAAIQAKTASDPGLGRATGGAPSLLFEERQGVTAKVPKRVTLVMEAPRHFRGQEAISPTAAPLGRATVAAPGGARMATQGRAALAVASSVPPGGSAPSAGSRLRQSSPNLNEIAPAYPTGRLGRPSAPTGASASETVRTTGASPEWLPAGAIAASGGTASAGPAASESSLQQAQNDQALPALGGGPTEGDVYLDGTLVGRWMARFLAQAAGRQPSGSAAFDPTRSRLPSGATIGV